MTEVIEIFDIAEVDKIYQKMSPIRNYPPGELKNHFIINYITHHSGIDNQLELSAVITTYIQGRPSKRYLIDRDEPLIQEVYRACAA